MGLFGSKLAPTNDNAFLAILENFFKDGNRGVLRHDAIEYFKGKKYATASSFDPKTLEWSQFGYEFAPTPKEVAELKTLIVSNPDVLDIGSGAFGLIGFFALCFNAQSYTAVDIDRTNVSNSKYFLKRVQSYFPTWQNTLIRVLQGKQDSWELSSPNGQQMLQGILRHSRVSMVICRNVFHHTKPEFSMGVFSFITEVKRILKKKRISVYIVVDHTIQDHALFKATHTIRKQIADLIRLGFLSPACTGYITTYVLKSYTSDDEYASNGFYSMTTADCRLNLEMIGSFTKQCKISPEHATGMIASIKNYKRTNEKVASMQKSIATMEDYFSGAIEAFYRTGLLSQSAIRQTLLFLPDEVDMRNLINPFNPQDVKVTYCEGAKQLDIKELGDYCMDVLSGKKVSQRFVTMTVVCTI